MKILSPVWLAVGTLGTVRHRSHREGIDLSNKLLGRVVR